MKGKLILILGLVLVLSVTACTKDDEPVEDVTPPVENSERPKDDAEGEPETTPEDSDEISDKWPEDFMPQAPKLAGEIVLSKEEGPKKRFLQFKDVSHDEANEYVASLKAAGFTEHTNEQINSNIVKYKGIDSNKNLIVFIWKEDITKLELIKEN